MKRILFPLAFLLLLLPQESLFGQGEDTALTPFQTLVQSKNKYNLEYCPDDSNRSVFKPPSYLEQDYLVEKIDDSVVVRASTYLPEAISEIQIGESLFYAEQPEEARVHYLNALKIDSLYPRLNTWIGDTYFMEHQYDEAVTWYQRCLEKNPADFQAYRFMAHAYENQGKLEDARDAIVSALIYNINYSVAWDDLHRLGLELSFPVIQHPFRQRCWLEQLSDTSYRICIDSSIGSHTEQSSAWLLFISAKAVWQVEGKFFKSDTTAQNYSLTLAELDDCFSWMISAWETAKQEDSTLTNPELDFYSEVSKEGFQREYILLEIVSRLDLPKYLEVLTEENLYPRFVDFFKRYYLK